MDIVDIFSFSIHRKSCSTDRKECNRTNALHQWVSLKIYSPRLTDWQPCTTHRFCQVLQRHINIRENSVMDLLRPDLHLSIIQNEAAAGHWRNRSLWRLIWRKYTTHLKLNSGVQQPVVHCRSFVPIGIVSKLVYGGKIWGSCNLEYEKETRICGASKWHLAWTPWALLGKGMATKGWRIAARNTSTSSVRTYMRGYSIPPDSNYIIETHIWCSDTCWCIPSCLYSLIADSTNTHLKGFKSSQNKCNRGKPISLLDILCEGTEFGKDCSQE